MKLRQKKAKNKLLLQYGIGIALVVLVMTTSFLYLITLSMKPYQDARVEGEKLAKQYAELEQADQVDFYNGLEGYYSVLGHNKKQEVIAVLIEKNDHKIYVYQLDKGISQDKAATISREKGANDIDKITFGRYQDKPIWEVKSGNQYYLVDFETGAVIQ